MEVKEIIKHTVERVREDYIKDYKAMEHSDFNDGVLLGISIVLTALKNDLIGLEDSCLDDEANIADFGLDFDIDKETMWYI